MFNKVKNRKSEKIKEASVNGEKEADTSGEKENKELVHLYILCDKMLDKLRGYLEGFGIDVSGIFTDVDDILKCMIMQDSECRIVIVDSGTGRFNITENRIRIIELTKAVDEKHRVTVIYTSSALYNESRSMWTNITKKAKADWVKYENYGSLVKQLNKYNEIYVKDTELITDEEYSIKKDFTTSLVPSNYIENEDRVRLNFDGVADMYGVINSLDNTDEGLITYNIKY